MNTKFITSFILSLATVLLVGCSSGESQSESTSIATPDSSVVGQEEVAVTHSNSDTLISDDEWVYQLIDLVEAKSFNLKPDSIRPIKNTHLAGVIDTLLFVSSEGLTAMLYAATYDGRQMLRDAEIDLESELGLLLWRDLTGRHSLNPNSCIRIMNFEATHEVKVFCDNERQNRLIYCLLHRE